MITLIENFRALFYAPFYAAEALGAYAAEGLEVRMTLSAAAEKTLVSLNAGAGDVSWGGPLRVMTALDQDRNGGYVAFCEAVARDPFYLLGRVPNPGYVPMDLIGQRVAIVTEVPTPWICMQYDLRGAGIDPAAITRSPGRTMAQNAAALAAGEVDVIQVFEPYAQNLIDSGQGHIWYAAAARGLTSYTSFNTTRAFIDSNPQAVLGMTRAMHRTQKWIAAHDAADLAELIGGYFPSLPRATLEACFTRYQAAGLWNTTPAVHREGIERLRDAMLAAGFIRTRLAYDECVDNRFAERSVREDPPSL